MFLRTSVICLSILWSGLNPLHAQTTHIFRPSDTDNEITDFDNRHYAYVDESSPRKQKLVVFLPGTGGTPFFYRQFLVYAASLGYHSLGLMYPNNRVVKTVCALGDRNNPDCFRDVRLEIIDGEDRTPLIDVDATNSIQNRLIRALAYLDDSFPEESWADYLNEDGAPKWDRVVICGHSQGGGHAALIAKRYTVDRCLVFAAADWYTVEERPANWVTEASATPAHQIYVFAHLRDELVDWNHLLPVARAFDLDRFGEPVSADQSFPNGGNTFKDRHILTTDTDDTSNFHNSMIVDAHTPQDETTGKPLFQAVWNHMLLSETQPLTFEHREPGRVLLYWKAGNLQHSVDLTTWTDTNGAESPLEISLETVNPRIFYRVEP